MTKYLDWISELDSYLYGKCSKITRDMVEAFPELTRVRGHYLCPFWGEREHWWCVDQDGTIVDPTANQFPSRGSGVYRTWDETQSEPTGKCPNCGDYAYNGDTCCSIECDKEFVDYLMS